MTGVLPGALTLLIAFLAGLAGDLIGAPLPWLLGPLLAAALVAMGDWRPAGVTPRLPRWSRSVFVPVIGTAIGATVTPEILDQVARWWPSLIAVVPFVVVVQLTSYAVLRRLGGFDAPTAFFAASPGGLVDAVLLGERRAGDVALMSTQHFARIALSVASVPLILALVAGPVAMPASVADPIVPQAAGAAALALCAVVGALAGLRLGLPAGVMLGPFLLSGALHLADVTSAQVPVGLVHLAQMVVGSLLGQQFTGLTRRRVATGFGLAALTTSLALAIAAGLAVALTAVVPAPGRAIFLAFAPGGVAEMGLIAVSLGVEPAFVIVHHLLRIVLTVTLGPLIFDLLLARGGTSGGAP